MTYSAVDQVADLFFSRGLQGLGVYVLLSCFFILLLDGLILLLNFSNQIEYSLAILSQVAGRTGYSLYYSLESGDNHKQIIATMLSLHLQRVNLRVKVVDSVLVPVRLQQVKEILNLSAGRVAGKVTHIAELQIASFPGLDLGEQLRQ